MIDWVDGWGAKVTLMVSGIIGGVVSIIVDQPSIGTLGKLSILFVGAGLAYYIAPMGEKYIGATEGFWGFFLGALGIPAMRGLLVIAHKWEANPITTFRAIRRSSKGNEDSG